jgi:hypothetical protein
MALYSRTLWPIAVVGLLLAGRAELGAAQLAPRASSGCAAVNGGAFDLDFRIDASGVTSGLKGSGLVKGFAEGDVLTFAQRVTAGAVPLVHQLRLAGYDPGGANLLATVFALEEHVVRAGERWSESGAAYVIPRGGGRWSLFTAGSGEGEGAYSLTVRCAHDLLSSLGARTQRVATAISGITR